MGLYECIFFFFNDTATTEIYTLSLHDALPISARCKSGRSDAGRSPRVRKCARPPRGEICRTPEVHSRSGRSRGCMRSEEHTSELQSRQYLVCRLLLEKKK